MTRSWLLIILTIIAISTVSSAFLATVIGWVGRSELRNSQVAGCERGKLDREANAAGWRIAQAARLADGQFAVAKKYGQIAAGLEQRARIDCEKRYPAPSIIPGAS